MYLNCKTFFSFLYGTYTTEGLIKDAAEKGVTALALTNINSTCDVWDFVDDCRQHNIKPVGGAEIRNDGRFLYLLLAKNSKGFSHINHFLSQHLHSKTPFPERPVFEHEVFIVYSLEALSFSCLLPHELIGVQTTEVNKLFGIDTEKFRDKLVICHPVTFSNKTYYQVHRLLRAIDKNILLSKLQPEDVAGAHETFLAPSELLAAFQRYPFIVTNTLRVLECCTIEMEFHTDKTKKVFSASLNDDQALLEKLALDGLKQRYSPKNTEAQERVNKELRIISELGFTAYFLLTWDIVRYAQSRGFYYVGRGSGANSIVAYCLKITDVDPIELDLYFERFLNPYRSTPPDFDLDFSWKDRDEVIDYIFKRYGRGQVCLLGAYSTFQFRAAVRELGKVFGLPKLEIDALEKSAGKEDILQKKILYYGSLIQNFPHHLSVHAGGMLISEEPIARYTATELPPKGFSTSQIDMFVAEKIGLYKLDILSQRGLGHIKEAIELVQQNRGVSIDIHTVEVFKKDAKVAGQIQKAATIGCFYIESPAMRQLLQKLRCADYRTLVAASSIIRPGVAQSGMMRQYIYRFHHPDDFEYLHPKMKELLEETYGVMVYQEDVIKVAHHFAGLDMGQADVLRRAMSGKYRGNKQLLQIKEQFFANCQERGYAAAITEEVWRQIESFGGYSFSKAHSASYAVESYQSLYLKTYYPQEFMVAVINNFGGFYSTELYFHELKKAGATLHAPCVNRGSYLTSLTGSEVWVGFIHVQGLEQALVEQLLEERKVNGNFLHLQNFMERLRPGTEQLNLLIQAGAFRFSGKSKKELLWQANFLQKKSRQHSTRGTLFAGELVQFQLPTLEQHPLDDALDEIELLGYPLQNPFELVEADAESYTAASELPHYLGKEVTVLGYWITSKPVHTIKKETMYFHTFIDGAGDWLDTVFFPQVARLYPVSGKGFYVMKGKVVEEFGVYSLEVLQAKKIGIKERM